MSNAEFFKRWLIANMVVLGAALVTNAIVVTWTGRPIHFVIPGFTTDAFASDSDRHHK